MSLGTNDAQLGQLTTLSIAPVTYSGGTATVGTAVPVGVLVSVDGPGTTVDEVETPLLSSVTKLFAAGLPETEVTFNIRHNGLNASVVLIRAAVKVYPVPNFQWVIGYPDGTADSFTGFPKGYTVSGIEGANPVMAAIPVRATGQLTNGSGSGS
jgi:hypothetical protein